MNWQDLASAIESAPKGEPIYVQIVRYLTERIASGVFPDGMRLPTNRELSSLLRVDRSTVARAYGELMESGLIDSRVGRGTIVRRATKEETGLKTRTDAMAWNDLFSRSSRTVVEMMDKQPPVSRLSPNMVSFAGGLPTEEFYPSTELQRMVSDILAQPNAQDLFAYSPAEGHATLRLEVLKHLHEQGIDADDDELLIVSGSQQAIDLVTDVLIDPGDTVLLENPSYFWAICNLKSHQARCMPIRVDADGLDVEELEREVGRNRPKLIYVMPSFQNPTGAALSFDRRIKLLEIANKYGVPILEDNFVGDLRYEGDALPPLRALPGGKECVIHQGTFSKALCPGLRLGWIVAPREVLSRLLLAKRVSDLSTNSMAQLTLAHYLSAGLYSKHLERVRSAYKARRDTMLEALRLQFRDVTAAHRPTWSTPEGGLFVWMKLPAQMSSRELLRFAEQEAVTFSPGDLFFIENEKSEFLRLCFIQTDHDDIRTGIERLALSYKKYLQSVIDTGAVRQNTLGRNRDQVLI